ncbi:GFA family protein [Microbulbifer sp. SA54]|uniref:GFA family protein n=1 Tax=Microbulbifer sp. SA54 TaxID=3401577 RepID=UPI003AADAD19
MKTFGRCHCGNISIEVAELPTEVTSCNCSLCRRYAGLWAYYAPGEVNIHYKDTEKSVYIWGDRDIEHHRCHHCGCVTHYITTEKCPVKRVAVNARMADPELLATLKVRQVDGASF